MAMPAAFYFPDAHRQIDWSKGYTFLDQELQAVTRDAEIGKRFVDKLVQVHRLSGQEDWIYIHLEIQGMSQAEFAKRMFVYNYRIFDKYDRPWPAWRYLPMTAWTGNRKPMVSRYWAASTRCTFRWPS